MVLDELHHIMQYRKDEGQFVIPIFYKVEPRDVRNQTGPYKEAFEKHEKNYQYDPDRVKRWRAALSEAGNLSGWDCKTSTDETKLLEEIVADVSTKLECMYNCEGTSKDVVGIDEMIEPIQVLLKKSDKVGIWGMGGAGKTTMAKVVFDNLSSQYNHRWFLENVREETEKKGLKHVRDFLVSKLLGKDMQIDSSNEKFVVGRLGRTKAFVVLDDVDTAEQLKNLQDNTCNFLKVGSKVIITTRDQKLLREKGYEIHEAKGLSYENSCRLFIRKAFGSDNAEDGYKELIKGFVDYTKHNPLALEVLGSYVHSEDKKFWGDSLKDLRAGNPHDEIQKVLKLSYDKLHPKVQQIFLDIACFLKGESEEFVKELLESYDFYLNTGMQTLKDKALVDTTSGKVEMHDLIQEMGRRIVCEENMDPGKRSRLWDPKEIRDSLKKCEGEKEVEGIMLDTYENRRALELTAKTFNKMTRLRFLKVDFHWGTWMSPSSLESISTRMRYFHWKSFPMKSLPSNFCAQHLVELSLRNSLVETLWKGVQDLPNLRRLNLGCCSNLRELPDFSKACRLESVDLSFCRSLCYLHVSLLSHHSLISLDLSECISLKSITARGLESISTRIRYFYWIGYPMKSLPSNFCAKHLVELSLGDSLVETLWKGVQDLANLRRLKLACCDYLRELPDFSKACRLESVNLSYCGSLCYVHESLLSLHSLIFLDVSFCYSLESLQSGIHLKSLKEIYIDDCYNLKEFSVSSEALTSLKLSNPKIEELGPSIGLCSKLGTLSLVGCQNLTGLPDSITLLLSLESLYLEDCPNLTKLPDNMRLLSKLQHLRVTECTTLHSLPELPPSLRTLYLVRCNLTELPDSITLLLSLEELYLEKCPNLTKLPDNMRLLSKLQHLHVTKCTALHSLPELPPSLRTLYLVRCNLTELLDSITLLLSLEELYLEKCPNLIKLPDNMRLLSKLQHLHVTGCTALHSLPELPPSLIELKATNCTSLETVSLSTISITPQNKGKKFFSFINCVNLDLGVIEEQVKLLLEKAVHEKEHVQVYYPGKKVPEWFGNNRKQNDSDSLKLCLSSHNLVGFVFCAVTPDLDIGIVYPEHLDVVFSVEEDEIRTSGYLEVVSSDEEDEMTENVVESEGLHDFPYGNVFLRSNPKESDSLLRQIEGKRRIHAPSTSNPNLSFELRCYRHARRFHDHRFSTEEFGVYPIYASELNSNFWETQGRND